MRIEDYYSKEQGAIRFTRQQASSFAKRIADDFNPLHDPAAKLFCVPGDLLFALVLSRYGVSQRMRFHFSGMVGDDVALQFPSVAGDELTLTDQMGKPYLEVERSGERSQAEPLLTGLIKSYVEFSGHTFPHVLVPLMAEQGVMINPNRPLVIYDSMEINLQCLDVAVPQLEFTGAHLDVTGKKGVARLEFQLKVDDRPIGHGAKYMALRGLRPYEQDRVTRMVEEYNRYKQAYSG